MKRSTCVLLSLFVLFSLYVSPTFAAETEKSALTWEETYTDKLNNFVRIEFEVEGEVVTTVVYVNNILTQKATISPENDTIVYEDYSAGTESKSTATVNSPIESRLKYSDFITPVTPDPLSPFAPLSSWDPEGWGYYGYFAPSPILPGAQGTNLYVRNYDEEPDSNRYLVNNVNIGPGTPISIATGLVVGYVTGELSAIQILIIIGSSIFSDVVTNTVSSQICFSTQKILYAPIINGINVFPDAYITKQWLIGYDFLTQKESITLANEAFASNRGQSPSQIAINAQIAML